MKVLITNVNDGLGKSRYWGDTPKERILNTLYEIRRRESEAK
jgi:hypothetical protein